MTDTELLAFFPDGLPPDYLKLGDTIVCDWETAAEIHEQPRSMLIDCSDYKD